MLSITTFTSILISSIISLANGMDTIPYTDTPCERLQLRVSGDLAFLSGIYRLKYNSSQIYYSHECASFFLFKVDLDGDVPVWLVGPKMGSKRGYAITKNLMKGKWKHWDIKRHQWVTDDTCHAFYLRGEALGTISGYYLREGKPHNGLPVYRRHDVTGGSVFYVYHNVAPCPHWAIGSSIGDQHPFIFTFSTQNNPSIISHEWRVHHKEGPISIAIRFQCHEKLSGSQVCGERQIDLEARELIVGGAEARKGDWPFVVSYKRMGGQHKCGAVILNRRWILTAGHCVPSNDESEQTKVQVGVHDMQTSNEELHTATYKVRRTLHRPDFEWSIDNFKLVNDVGLIELQADLIFNSYVQPVCLPSFTEDTFSFSSGNPSNISSCFLVGWGEQWYKGPPAVLQTASVLSIASVDRCATHHVFSPHLTWMKDAKTLCIQTERGGRICKGDSGSPLLCEEGGRWFVMGVASWSLSQCYSYVSGIPSIYEQVSPWMHWIQHHILAS